LLRKKSSDVPKELTPVPDAHTPIIKLKWANVDIDLIFVSLKTSSIPEDIDLKEESHLRGLDETDLRSINGTRVSDEILSLLPEAKAFRHTLRAVKLWAQRRGIYGNVFGFPGGVAWAILVGRICQLYPFATGATIVTKFFNLMAQWPWPKPVMLKHHQEQGPLQVRVWNPAIYPSDAGHLMPILTPAYPGMCCTHNVTQSTKAIILRELARANQIASDILNGKKPWSALFEKQTFFTQDYKHYLSIHCASRTKEGQHIWCGYVQSRVRRLVTGIELSAAGVKLAHPYVKGFDRIHVCKIENIDAVLMGDLQYEVKEAPQVVRDGYTVLYSTTYYLGLEMKEVSGGQLDISHAVGDFTHQSTQWQSYTPDENFIRVVHTRNYDLPLDVFELGEKRPVKKKKKAGKPTTVNGAADETSQPNSLKRKSTDGVESPNAKRQRPHDTSNEAAHETSQPNSLKRKSTDVVESPNAKRQRPHDTSNEAADETSQPNLLKRKSIDDIESPNAKKQRPHDTSTSAVRQVRQPVLEHSRVGGHNA
jgi:poly(A) polymerase